MLKRSKTYYIRVLARIDIQPGEPAGWANLFRIRVKLGIGLGLLGLG